MKPNHSNRDNRGTSSGQSTLLVFGLIALLLDTGSGLADAPEKSLADQNAEAKERTEPIKGVPPRDTSTKPNLIDLSDHFNGSPREGWIPTTPSGTTAEKTLPIPLGVGPFDGVDFDVRGLIQLSGEMIKKAGGDFPEQVKGIKVGQKCKRLHFLQASTWGQPPYLEEGVQIGMFVLHYADGSEREIPIVNGEDLRDWLARSKEDPKRATIVWSGENPTKSEVRVYKSTSENPLPDQKLESIDYVSKMTAASPFLLAITLE